MSKVRVSALLLIMLLTFTASTAVVSADSVERIKFNGLASGPCFIIYGLGTRGPNPFPDQEIWYFGEGAGTTQISGRATELNIVEVTDPNWGEGYESTEIRAVGHVSVSWTNIVEEEEEKNLFIAVIFSSASTYGFFKLNEVFSVPIPGVTPPEYEELLLFKGIHIKNSEIDPIEGFALCMATPLESIPGQSGPGYLYNVGLVIPLEGDDQIMYQLMWSDVNALGIVPPTDNIKWNVEAG